MNNLDRTRIHLDSAPLSICPGPDVWPSVAAGLPIEDRESLLRHALDCHHCGFMLQQAARDLEDDETPDERFHLDKIESSHPEWHRKLAIQLAKEASTTRTKARRWIDLSGWQGLLSSRLFAFSVSSAAILAILLLGWDLLQRTPESLIQYAFVEQRTLEVRFDGMPYEPLRQERNTASTLARMKRPYLLAAETEISKQLKKHPDDVSWLQAMGRALLLEGQPDSVQSAFSFLEKAHRLDPFNNSVSNDLASACIMRGETLPTDPDPGRALQLLRPLATSNDATETAEWNYAIALQKAGFKQDAITEWNSFLANHSHSAWRKDANTNLSNVQTEVADERRRRSVPLLSLDKAAEAYRTRDVSALGGIDDRIEEYQELAIENWLPIVFSDQPDSRFSQARLVLTGLAGSLRSRNSDAWLTGLLAASSRSLPLQHAVQLLAHSTAILETSDAQTAAQEADEATALFEKSQFPAGALRSQLVIILAAQYKHQDQLCETLAKKLASSPLLSQYPWIAIQANLEIANCAPAADLNTLRAAETATNLSKHHHFPILTARSLVAQSSLYALLGERSAGWRRAFEALAMYWNGNLPNLSGYNALIALEELNRPSDRWFLQADILREAVPMVDGDSRTLMVAVANAHLGQALIRIGDLQGAEAAFLRSEALVQDSTRGPERDALSAETELGLAKVEMERNQLAQSSARLKRLQGPFDSMPGSTLQLAYFETRGLLHLKMNRLLESQEDLDSAAKLAAVEVRDIKSIDDRWGSNQKHEGLFRSIVELELRTDPNLALFAWEHFKANALPEWKTNDSDPNSIVSATRSPITVPSSMPVQLIYVAFPDGYAVWRWDSKGIKEQWIALDMVRTSALISKFVEECSDPNSRLDSLKGDSSELYTRLVRPIEPWLAGQKQIILEPDGPLKKLPFGLLINSHGSYLGDTTTISFSPGVAYLNRARAWKAISSQSTAFIVANPRAAGWSPLPAADEEARAVASSFLNPKLIVDSSAGNSDRQAEAIASAEIFHFSGHASITLDGARLVGYPEFSSQSQFDAFLQGQTQLVVLSACDTYGSADGLFDGSDGLVRDILASRVPVVVASRWAVDSSSTATLMSDFYAGLRSQESPSASLSEAMHLVRNTPGYEHPYYWAAFSVFGRN
ncbi:MAG TPA: CHAT domain-containing protein [Terracidiphilus sp.]|jgi:CHAT domain-containing protein